MSGIGTPYENMATDEALFDAACTSGIPVLRLYGWTPATVSLGFAQRASDTLDFAEIDRRHLAWVRRPTGGRAVLHDMEVTYSVSIPRSDPLYALGLEASYEWICGPIVAALLAVGVSAALAPHGSSGFVSPSCFTAPGTTDVVVDQKKIVGSAQMRTQTGFLQHGSLVLKNDMDKLFAVIRTSQPNAHDAARRAARLMTSVCDETHRVVSFSEMANALIASFGSAEGIHLLPDSLTAQEALDVSRSVAGKYGREDWNAFR